MGGMGSMGGMMGGMGGMMGGMGGSMGMDMMEEEEEEEEYGESDGMGMMGMMGMMGGPMGLGGQSMKAAPPEPNGVIIIGYARTPEAVTAFVDNLKNVGLFKFGVYFDESTVVATSAAELDNANTGGMGGGMMGGMGDMGGMGGGMMGGMGGMMGSMGMGGRRGGLAMGGYMGGGPIVYTFRVDCQLKEEKKAESAFEGGFMFSPFDMDASDMDASDAGSGDDDQ
jgi:hypothetical protein